MQRPSVAARRLIFQMRFEVAAAFVIGILLPILETARRGIGHWAVEFTTMFEDYVAGALLLIAAWASYRARSWGSIFLVLAWGYFSGLMSSSFWWQLEELYRQIPSEPNMTLANEVNTMVVIVVKFLLWSTAITSLVLSFRSALQARTA